MLCVLALHLLCSQCQLCETGKRSNVARDGCGDLPFNWGFLIVGSSIGAIAALVVLVFGVRRIRRLKRSHGIELGDHQAFSQRLLDSANNPLEQDHFYIPPEDLHLKERIGAGGCGWIYKAHLGVNTIVAAKEIITAAIDPEDLIEFEHEARMLTEMNHPHVLRVLGFCTKPADEYDDKQEHRYIVTEFAPNGSLENIIEKAQEELEQGRPSPFTKIQALEWALQIASGMAFLNGKGFVHRDIKPQNILLNKSNDALVADLGTVRRAGSIKSVNGETKQLTEEEQEIKLMELSKLVDAENGGGGATRTIYVSTMTGMRGTPLYMAPEQYYTEYSYPVDVWAYGLTLIRLFSLKWPYPNNVRMSELMQGVREGTLLPTKLKIEDVPDIDVLNVIEECLEFDSKKRSTFKKIERRLNNALKRCKCKTKGAVQKNNAELLKILGGE